MVDVIAELSGNHNGSLELALRTVDAIANTGAKYFKLQTYTADTITLPVTGGLFNVSDGHELWGSRNLYDLYTEAHTPWEWHKPIFDRARNRGLVPFSTPFDETAVDFLEDLDVPLYKIASLEIVDLPLISYVARTGKPMIISTGTATLAEVAEAVETARSGGCKDLTLLVCTSSYPAKAADSHLARLPYLKALFDVSVGFSDHTLGSSVASAAAALGATLFEKHIILERKNGGVDSAFSMEPDELTDYVLAVKEASASVGLASAWSNATESESLRHRPSIYISTTVSKGEKVTAENVRTVRPSGGLAPKYLGQVLGRSFADDYAMGDPLSWDKLSGL